MQTFGLAFSFYFRISDLVFAALHREPTMLEEALDRAKEANKNQSQLTVQIKVARKLLGRLSKIERVSSARRLTMDSKSLAEVKQYTMPPYGVHHTVAATFLLLGDELDTLKVSISKEIAIRHSLV